MLKLAGITKDTPQPKYGFIEKHPQTGEPTGYLAETAMQAVFSKIPMYPDEVWERALKRVMQELSMFTSWKSPAACIHIVTPGRPPKQGDPASR